MTCNFSFRRFFPWFFGFQQASQIVYGSQDAFGTLLTILGLMIGVTASFVLALNQVPGSLAMASLLFVALTAVALILIAVVINDCLTSSANSVRLRYGHASLIFGRFVSGTIAVLTLVTVWMGFTGWFPGQRPERREFTLGEVACALPELASARAAPVSPTGVNQSPESEDAAEVERFVRWFGGSSRHLDPKKQQILIVKQSPAFDADFRTFSAVMHFTPAGIEFKDALVFLRRKPAHGGGPLRYLSLPWAKDDDPAAFEDHQLRLPREQSGRPYPVVTVPQPNEGDSLLMLVLVEASEGRELPSDPAGFNFRLRRVKP